MMLEIRKIYNKKNRVQIEVLKKFNSKLLKLKMKMKKLKKVINKIKQISKQRNSWLQVKDSCKKENQNYLIYHMYLTTLKIG